MQNTNFSYIELAEEIITIYKNFSKYQFDKHIIEFSENGKFVGDYFNYFIFEPQGKKPPIFYHIVSPFDLVSRKSPQQAIAFADGKVILNIDFTNYVIMRTGVMDALLLKTLKVNSLSKKNILYIGTGKIAQASLSALKTLFPELKTIDFISHQGNDNKFDELAKNLSIKIISSSIDNISKYDFIFCHTNTSESILKAGAFTKIKKGAVITTYISSTENGEVDDVYYDTTNASVIIDWELTITGAKDLARAIKIKRADPNKIQYLKDIITLGYKSNSKNLYTIYRSTGTPMQSFAVLKLLRKINGKIDF